MQKVRVLKKALTVILLLALSAAFFTTAALAAEENDYSKPGSVLKAELTSLDILSLMIDEEIVGAEREYLELYGDFKISHGANIPSSQITLREDSSEGKLFVKASPYSYVAQNGVTVTFIPERVYVKDAVFDFAENESDEFILEIDTSYSEGEERLRVIYSTEIEVSASDANALLNKAYYDAAEWKRIISEKEFEYIKAKAEYLTSCELYEKYVAALAEYEAARAAYDEYILEKLSYDRRLSEYKQYLSDLSVYEDELKAYEAYLEALKKYDEDLAAYREYLYVKENYDTLLQKYEKYERDIEAVRYQLSVIDGLKNKSTALSRSIYSAVVIGTTVTEVIENKDAIANSAVGVRPEVVDLAGESTENIRQLCIPYFKLETEAQKYAYYVVNYEGFRSNFTSLFIALDNMYANPKVRGILKNQGMQEKYEILLAQLYYTVNALNDGPVYNYDKTAVYDSKYVVNPNTKETALSALDKVPYIVDRENLATPISTGYPTEVEKPSDKEIPEPTVPTFVPEPAEPYKVENPGIAPTEILEPQRPREVEAPGEEPVPYEPDTVVKALVRAFEEGDIPKRNETFDAVKVKHEVEVYKTIGDAELVIVEFLNDDGSRICDPILVEKGTYADFPGQTPERESDAEADYKFAYWVNSDGVRSDLESVNSDLTLYPYFEKQTKSYKIVWKIGNSSIEETVSYGEIPTPPANPERLPDERYEYIFDGWDKEISAVSGEETYRALFKQIPIFVAQNGNAATVRKNESGYLIDCGESSDYEFNLTKLLTLVTKADYIDIKSGNCALTLSPEAIEQIKGAGAVTVRVNTEIVGAGYTVTLLLLGENGNIVDCVSQTSSDIRITLSKAITIEDPDALRLYYLEDGKRRLVKASYENGFLTAAFTVGEKYYVTEEYSLSVLSSGGLEISVPAVAKKGERVRVEIFSLPENAILDEVYYLDTDGKKVIIENGEFIMPSHSVIVGAEYHIPTFTVTFIADGKVILSIEYKLGDKVSVPAVPDKASDSRYYYTRGFWTPEVTDVLADAVYEAKYIPSEIIREEDDGGLQLSQELKDLLAKVFLIAFFVLTGIVIVALTVIIVRRRRY